MVVFSLYYKNGGMVGKGVRITKYFYFSGSLCYTDNGSSLSYQLWLTNEENKIFRDIY